MKAAGWIALAATLVLSSAAASETYGLKAARAALSGKSQAVIVAVPAGWVSAKTKLGADEAETAGDWSYYFTAWLGSYRDRTNVVIVTPAELRRLMRSPDIKADCATIFVRQPGSALVYDGDCVPMQDQYASGSEWMRSGAAPKPDLGLRAVDLKLR